MTIELGTVINGIGWAVLHFLWQGAAIGLIAAAALAACRSNSPATRYTIACFGLAACAFTFVATASMHIITGSNALPAVTANLGFSSPAFISSPSSGELIDSVAMFWAFGVLLLTIRMAQQVLITRRLRTLATAPPDDQLLALFETLKLDLGLTSKVRLLRSGLAEAPMVVGWFSPIILIPISACTSLSPGQLRAVLAHELSHIRRGDHLINAAQVLLETTLFFHPAIWWLSNRIRQEREHCCDDAAVFAAGNPRILAEALMRLETLRAPIHNTVLAATGGPLMNRIARILIKPASAPRTSRRWQPAFAITASLLVSAAGLTSAVVASPTGHNPIADVLRTSVATGGLSSEEARTIYDSIVYPGSEAEHKITAGYNKSFDRIQVALAAGKLSEADAASKQQAVLAELIGQQQMAFAIEVLGKSRSEAYIDSVSAQLDALVLAGALTADAAVDKLAITQRQEAIRAKVAAYYDEAAAKLERQVRAGEISEDAAAAQLSELKSRLAERAKGHAKSITPEDLEVIGVKIREAVAAGEMTAEEGREKMVAMRKQLAGAENVQAKKEGIMRRLDAAVDRGDMTREQADAKLAELTRIAAATETGKPRGKTTADWEAITRQIEEAVERGEMTREDANAKHQAIRERRAASSDR